MVADASLDIIFKCTIRMQDAVSGVPECICHVTQKRGRGISGRRCVGARARLFFTRTSFIQKCQRIEICIILLRV